MKAYDFMYIADTTVADLQKLGADGWYPALPGLVRVIGAHDDPAYTALRFCGLLQREIEGPRGYRVVGDQSIVYVVADDQGGFWYVERDPGAGVPAVVYGVRQDTDTGSARKEVQSSPFNATRLGLPLPQDDLPHQCTLSFRLLEEALCAARRFADGRPVFPLYPLDPSEWPKL